MVVITGKIAKDTKIIAQGLTWSDYSVSLGGESPGVTVTYAIERLEIDKGIAKGTTSAKFLFTNLRILRPIRIDHPSGTAWLRPLPQYKTRIDRLGTLKLIEVTAELEIEVLDTQTRDAIADDLTYLLSIASGTKINWISRLDLRSDEIVGEHYSSRITKPYAPWPVIDHRQPEDLDEFLKITVPPFVERKEQWRLAKGLIDSYIDAKSENDYLQIRGVKLVVAVEMLKSQYLHATGESEFVRSSSDFDAIRNDLKSAAKSILTSAGWTADERDVTYRKITELNRFPFKDILKNMLRYFDLSISEEDIDLFIQSRDSLVHNCRLLSEIRRVPEFEDETAEDLWVCHFVDRLFLRLVGYRGPYIDYRTPGPTRRETF